MANVTIVFKEDGETITGSYSDPAHLMEVLRFVVYGISVESLTLEM